MATGTKILNGYDDHLGELVLSSRPGWATLALPLIFATALVGLSGVLYIEQRQPGSHLSLSEATWIIAVFVSIAVGLLAASISSILVLRIDIYEKGLSWRGFRGRRQALWSEITDYYLLYAESKRHYRVETANGSKLSFSDAFIAWRDYKCIPDEIQNRAIPTQNMPWQEKGGRLCDSAPTVFKYKKWQHYLFLLVLTALIGVLIISADWHSIFEAFKSMGIWWGILAIILILSMLVYPTMLLGLLGGVTWTSRSYMNDQIEITPDDVRILTTSGTRSYKWQDVIDLRREPFGKLNLMGNLVIHFADGWQYPVFTFLTNYAVFRRRIEALSGKKVRNPSGEAADDLGKEADRWSSGVVGLGSQRFHYRTRSSRAMSLLLLTCIVIPSIAYYVRPKGATDRIYILTLVLLPLYFYCLWRYWKAAILVDEIGITQLAPFGQIVIKWDEIESVTYVSGDLLSHYRIDGKGRKIRIYISLSHLSDLLNIIKEKGHAIEGK